MSLPSRGAWIEISRASESPAPLRQVAPLAGSVDRNYKQRDDVFQRL